MFKAIIFDIGGVLIDNPWPGMVRHYAQHLGVDEEKFAEAHQSLLADWQRGRFLEKEYWQKITNELKSSLPQTEKLWQAGFLSTYKEKPETFQLIKKLKQKGYKIAILSNTEIPAMEILIEKKYPDFDVFVYSCQIGMMKPDAEIYEETAKQLGIKPSEAIFIDDKPENVEGANKVGMRGVLFETSEKLEKLLLNL